MPKEYDAFIDDVNILEDGKEIDLSIRELTPDDRRDKYRTTYVKVLITHNPGVGKDDLLWIRYQRGSHLHPKPFGIKILKKLGEYQPKSVESRT
jgi:hypothetical protein